MTVRGTIIWLICAFFFLYEFFLRTVLGTFQSSIIEDLHLSAVQFAIISSTAYQIIYGLMQLPVGIIADRYGLKKTLLFAALICALSNFGFAFVHEYRMALVFRLSMGLGSSFGFVCLLLAVYDWLPRKNIAFFIGLSQFIGTLGPMLAAGPLNALLETNFLGWRELFLALALIGGVFAILVFCFVDKNREATNSFYILARPSSLLSNLYQLIRQKQVWWIGFYSSSVYFSLEYLSENEGTSFLMAKGHSATFAAYLITIAWLGYAIGCPVLGYLSDKLKQRKPIMLFSICLVLLNLSAIIYFPLNQLGILGCFFLLGIGASGQSIGFAIISEYCQYSYLTIGLAFNNTLIMFFGAISAPLIGEMLERGATTYSLLLNYQTNFSIMIAFILIGFIFSLLLIKETFCKQVHELTMLASKA
ncbi:MFS transporter [Legionella jamestowniensis]|uniref:Major facilitator superfamily (MFS) transporter n=1 Tax=Legionella jamestowniensis TaxID=455 RepID=A0A0W0UJ86_9GAMM|nr:MFS transporter [Legionella jamestowniensis]KTD07893.1 major facilitator superfamily (MFS) transporter [Legionella jamestowniensis]SFL63765.1 Predicted arabinose efflux permease, MFS family [Legionella jamestowniensis DSM 19215]